MVRSEDIWDECEAPDGEPSDRSLLLRLQRGSEDAATALYLRYAGRLQALARAQCSASLARRVEADDIVQSVFRMFFDGARQGFYEIPAGEDLWKLLLVIALNKIRAEGAFHQAAKRDVRQTASLDACDPAEETRLQQDRSSGVFLNLAVEEALGCLSPRQREMAELRIQGHEVAEIADKTGHSRRTVERNLQEIRARLKEILDREH